MCWGDPRGLPQVPCIRDLGRCSLGLFRADGRKDQYSLSSVQRRRENLNLKPNYRERECVYLYVNPKSCKMRGAGRQWFCSPWSWQTLSLFAPRAPRVGGGPLPLSLPSSVSSTRALPSQPSGSLLDRARGLRANVGHPSHFPTVEKANVPSWGTGVHSASW